jgi:hypothetical protein
MSRIVKIFELLFIIGLGVLVTLYVSAPVGVTILLMVIVGIFFSIAVTIATALMKAIKVTVSVSQTTLFKGEKTTLIIKVKNRTIIPAADVRIRLISPEKGLNAETEKNIVSFSVAGRAEEVLEIEYEAAIWGQYQIGIEQTKNAVKLGDFLGIFSLPWNITGESKFEVCVFPNIIEIPPEELIIGSALEAIYDDEAEETTETALPFGGFPGYNHRDYEPGDPIRRINWKLSAKRDKLLLRLDDEAETPEINICLTGFDEDRKKQEEAIEVTLGLADLFVKLDIKVKVHYSSTVFECVNADDIKNLQTAFLRYKFSDKSLLPDELSYYIKVSPNSSPELVKA